MGTDLGGIIIFITCTVYGLILQHLTGRRQNTDALVKAFIAIFAIGWAIHIILFSRMATESSRTLTDWLMIVYFSAQYTLEMFVAKTIAFKGMAVGILRESPLLFTALITTYYVAIITSALVIFHFVSRWAYGRRWLFTRKNVRIASEDSSHIFLGICKASILLASDIRSAGCTGKIIFIDIPDSSDSPKGISIWDIISRFFFSEKNKEQIEADVILKADKRMRGLIPWLQNPANSVYILSDDQDRNIKLAEALWQMEDASPRQQFKCRIYCHAAKEGIASVYSSVTDIRDRLTFVDSSFLAVESLKSHNSAETYPVSYVKKARNSRTGKLLGYVESDFNCAIIGFGETGHEALKFLYEFGAFVGKDKEKVSFRCHIFDNNASQAAGELKRKIMFPAEEEISFINCNVESDVFWDTLGQVIHNMNYIIVCLGNDQINLKTAADIAEFAIRKGRKTNDNFIIAFRQQEFSLLDKETTEKANRTFGGCLKPFGMLKDIWTLKVIKADNITAMAKKFYCSYLSAVSNVEAESAWAERLTRLQSDDYAIRNKARRQMFQDYSDCLHTITKRELCSPDTAEAARVILPRNIGTAHIEKGQCSSEDTTVLEYLAIGEHLRWNASHLILGYRYADETNDMTRTHSCIVPYNELSEEMKHYDWLVVKNSL